MNRLLLLDGQPELKIYLVSGLERGDMSEIFAVGAGTTSITNSSPLAGTYSARINPTAGTNAFHRWRPLGSAGVFAPIGRTVSTWYTILVRLATLPNGDIDIFRVQNTAGSFVIVMQVQSTGNVRIAGATNSASIATVTTDVTYVFELECVSNGVSTGYVDRGSGQTCTANNVTQDEVRIGSTATRTYDLLYDNFVISNRRLTDYEIHHLIPAADGVHLDMDAGPNAWQKGDDVPHDGDTTFWGSGTSGQKQTVTLESLGADASKPIIAVQPMIIARDEGGASSMALLTKSGATEVETTPVDPGSTYTLMGQVYTKDPATGDLWTPSGVQNLEIGPVNKANVAIRTTAASMYVLVQTIIAPRGIRSGERFGAASLALNITAHAIPSAEEFGAATVIYVVQASPVPSAEEVGNAALSLNLLAHGVESGERVGSPAFRLGLAPTGIESGERVGNASMGVQVGPQTGIPSAEAVGNATLTPGPVTISAHGISSAEAHGTARLDMSLQATGVEPEEAFGNGALSAGVSATGIPSEESVGSPAAELTVHPTGVLSGEAFGNEAIHMEASAGAGVPSQEAVGNAVLAAGVAQVEAHGIPSGEEFGGVAVTQAVIAHGVPTGESIGAATLQAGGVALQPGSIPGEEAVGAAELTQTIHASSIASGEAAGSPSVAMNVTAQGIPSGEETGVSAVQLNLQAAGIPTEESVGDTQMVLVVSAAGIESAEAFGTPVLVQPLSSPIVYLTGGYTPVIVRDASYTPTVALTGGFPMAKEAKILPSHHWFIGEDKILRFEIRDEDGDLQNTSGWTTEWYLRQTPQADTVLLTKTGAEVLPGVIDVTVTDEDTLPLEPGIYHHTLKRTNDGFEAVLAYGDAELRLAASR